MLLRQLEYLVALARARHFARAAQACFVSQPTLSEGIRKLEDELNIPLVRRGRRFDGFTPEGERVVVWARRILADRDAMQDEIQALRAGLTGRLRIGTVPTAATAVALLTQPFCAANPLATVQVFADLQSVDIVSRLSTYELDAAVTYHSTVVEHGFTFVPLYRERYVLLIRRSAPDTGPAEISWQDAAQYPLCLLHPGMQGRQVLEAAFEAAGVSVTPRVETDSIASLFAQVRAGQWASIVPHAWLHVFGVPAGMDAVPLVRPVRTERIGLVLPAREPVSVMGQALIDVAERAGVATVLEQLPD
ncbi:LysR substrate-binding domain-containing protein [Streptomyces panaciradicis]|uniref:LysR substrate-binding domain-containing protein n=1 Tax=Streptomyces panaciradicis TaxID=1470261 RepID=UPI00201CE7B3|nr:LysR family transcriptional regulator [Streptomyces panaciradicis]MCL6672421.1 LysR family transcriptional regulator [Streptomyces panaciradicis]